MPQIVCARCSQTVDVAGRVAACPSCGGEMTISRAAQMAADPATRIALAGPPAPSIVTPAPQFSPATADGYRCPHCQARGPAVSRTRISRKGWIWFAVLFVLFVPLCWVGLLMTEKYSVCGNCRRRI